MFQYNRERNRVEGWFTKQGRGQGLFGRRNWKRRFVTIEGGVPASLVFYNSHDDNTSLAVVFDTQTLSHCCATLAAMTARMPRREGFPWLALWCTLWTPLKRIYCKSTFPCHTVRRKKVVTCSVTQTRKSDGRRSCTQFASLQGQ